MCVKWTWEYYTSVVAENIIKLAIKKKKKEHARGGEFAGPVPVLRCKMYCKIEGGPGSGWGANHTIILANNFHLGYIYVENVIYHIQWKVVVINHVHTINTHSAQW